MYLHNINKNLNNYHIKTILIKFVNKNMFSKNYYNKLV